MAESLSKIDTNTMYSSSSSVKVAEKMDVEKSKINDITIFSSKSLQDSGVIAFKNSENNVSVSPKSLCCKPQVDVAIVIEPEDDERILSPEENKILENFSEQFKKDCQKIGMEKATQRCFQNFRAQFIIPSIEKNIKNALITNNNDDLSKELENASNMQIKIIGKLLQNMPKNEKEQFLLTVKADILNAHSDYLHLLEKNLPDNISEEQAKNVFGSVTDMYSNNQRIQTIQYAHEIKTENANLTDKDKYANFANETEKFLHDFWRTDKGKNILPWYKNFKNWLWDLF